MLVPVVIDDVVADSERGPVRHAKPAEHPLLIEAGVSELGFRLFPPGAFLGSRDGLGPGIWWSRECGLVECCCDAFGDDLREQSGADARPAEYPDAVVDFVSHVTREPQVEGTGNERLERYPVRVPNELMAGMGHDSDRAAMIYQHVARGADKTIADAIDTHVQAEQARRGNEPEPGTVLAVPPVRVSARWISCLGATSIEM